MPDYGLMARQIEELARICGDYMPLLSNASAVLNEGMEDINWVGFYLMDRGSLLLGPFQGRPACVRIDMGKGVCGAAAQGGRVLRVEDVHRFPGHIACDSASRSEIVLPIRGAGGIVGVLDIDSPKPGRFSAADEEGLGLVVRAIEASADFSGLRV